MEYEYWDMIVRNIHSAAILAALISTMVLVGAFITYFESDAEEQKCMRQFRWVLLIPLLSTLAYILTPSW